MLEDVGRNVKSKLNDGEAGLDTGGHSTQLHVVVDRPDLGAEAVLRFFDDRRSVTVVDLDEPRLSVRPERGGGALPEPRNTNGTSV